MLTYLFDASALVGFYAGDRPKVTKAVSYILEQRLTHRQATLYVPNVCIAEVFNALAKKHFREKSLDEEGYAGCLRRFRRHIHWARTLCQYEVNRYHIVAADAIIAVEQNLPSLDVRDHLSALDILVVAMACELAYLGRAEDTFLVTCDRRMKRVFEEFKRVPAERLSEWLATAELDYPVTRWRPPNCLLLQALRPGDLRKVDAQAAFNT